MTQFKISCGSHIWPTLTYFYIEHCWTQVSASRDHYQGLHRDSPLMQSSPGSEAHNLTLTGNNWDIVLHGHISWRAHVNIIDWGWRGLECQICNSRQFTLQFWLCEKWTALLILKVIVWCTKLFCIAMSLLHLEGRPGRLIPSDSPRRYGGALAFPSLVQYGGFH